MLVHQRVIQQIYRVEGPTEEPGFHHSDGGWNVTPELQRYKKVIPRGSKMNFRTGSIPTDVLNFKSRYPLLTLKKE